MKVLLDECVDRRLARHLQPFAVQTVPEMGWAMIENGQLLAPAERDFDVFLTVDRNLAFPADDPKICSCSDRAGGPYQSPR
jgi:hypothetical protein